MAAGRGHAQHGHGGFGRHHAGQVGCAARAGDDGLQPAAFGAFGVGEHIVGHAVGGYNARLVRNAELFQNVYGVLHGVPVGAGPHDDANQRCLLHGGGRIKKTKGMPDSGHGVQAARAAAFATQNCRTMQAWHCSAAMRAHGLRAQHKRQPGAGSLPSFLSTGTRNTPS